MFLQSFAIDQNFILSFTADQYEWLEEDLFNFDRNVTPWLVAAWYPSWYSTFKAHYREAECMRVEMEELLYDYGVDIVFNANVRVLMYHINLFFFFFPKCTLAAPSSKQPVAS